MLVAVVGATGSIGSPVAAELTRRGHEVRALSRSAPEFPVDLTTGAGLDRALAGCDVVVDATNATNPRTMRALLIDGSGRLLEAGERAGVSHHVCISIIGIERVPIPYYRAKVEQEVVVRSSGRPASIVRATQFHTLIAQLLDAAAKARLLPGGAARFQPVDPGEVAVAIAGVAEGGPRPETVSIGGPDVLELGALARTYKERTGRPGLVVPAPLPPRLGRALRDGALTAAAPDHRGTVGFGEWLAGRDAAGTG